MSVAVLRQGAGAVPVYSPSSLGCLEARRKYHELERWIFEEEAMRMPLHEVEAEQLRRAREMNRVLLEDHVRARGLGDVGPRIEVVSEEKGTQVFARGRVHACRQKTVFGKIDVRRQAYSRPQEVSFHPLDQRLELAERSFSYEVQRRVVQHAVQGPFDEATSNVEDLTGFTVHKLSAEAIVVEAAQDFDAFYQQREAPGDGQTGPILVGGVDGKGIPMKKPEGAPAVVRRKKGEKANKKRMATVATVHTQEPRVRTPEEVVESLFRSVRVVGSKKRVRPEHKRVWASLKKGKDGVIQEVAQEMHRRDPERQKIRVALTDGERALQKRVLKWLVGILLILDLFHVLEKLWKAAYVFHPEGSREAEEWVRERALRILQGKVSQVVQGIRQSATKRGLKGKSRKVIDEVTGYLYRNRRFMKYDEYLARGLPIASGPVEGACKNLIKDRMERSGMRWSEDGAEAMLKLRAIYLSGDLAEYWAFHIREDQRRLYPEPGRWRPVPGPVLGKRRTSVRQGT